MLRALLITLSMLVTSVQVRAQDTPVIPNFWDAQEQLIRPDVKDRPRLRFLTVTDFAPFSFLDERKRLTGFHVDLARAICEELGLLPVCQIQALPFDELEAALRNGAGDAILAGIPVDAETRKRLTFSRSYLHLPARFVAKRSAGLAEPLADALDGKMVGVLADTAHEAFARSRFGDIDIRLFANRDAALAALAKDEIAAFFGDALSLSFWLQSEAGAACCSFAGGPYLSTAYFGNGLAIAVKAEDGELAKAFDFALRALSQKGVFAEIYLRYFPIGLY